MSALSKEVHSAGPVFNGGSGVQEVSVRVPLRARCNGGSEVQAMPVSCRG